MSTSCVDYSSCDACTSSWSCVWCGSAQGKCVSGSPFGGDCSGVSGGWSWRQCSFEGWVLLLIVALGIVVLLAVLLLCCCCACRCRRQRRERRDYKDLERKQQDAKKAPHQDRLRAAIAPPAAASSPPPKQSWFKRMFSRSERPQGPTESTPLSGSSTKSERITTAEETNPFSISDV